jgi:hypothetical protein
MKHALAVCIFLIMSTFNWLQVELEPESEFKTRDIESVTGVNDPDVLFSTICFESVRVK